MNQSYLCRVLRGRYRAAETRLRGWAYRTRTRKCRFNPARSESVSSRRPRKVSGTKMLCKPKEFGRDYKKQTFASSSPLTPATQSGVDMLRMMRCKRTRSHVPREVEHLRDCATI